jgi:hypothetical protein
MHLGADILDQDDPESWSPAEDCYRKAIEGDEELRGAWFDLGLVHKWRLEWADALRCNHRALEIDVDDEQDPAFWNAGIAATALGDWSTARWAWAGYGVTMPDDFPDCEDAFGPGAVRLPGGEVVWGTRRDPARFRLRSVPLPHSGFRCGDVVLNDGAPNGSRVSGGREYPVFDVLVRLEASPLPTVEVDVETVEPSALVVLEARLSEADVVAENWTTSISIHCKACSEGRVDYDAPGHEHPVGETDDVTRFGCSGDPARITAVAEAWEADGGGTVHKVEVVA